MCIIAITQYSKNFISDSLYSGITAGGNVRYSWWMVILLTPFMLVMAVVQAAIDNNWLVMKIIGAIVSMQITSLSVMHYDALRLQCNYYS